MLGTEATTQLTRPDASIEKPISPAELAELISAFNDVTSNLSSTHESLRAEVARLEGELREARTQLARASQLAALGEMAAGIAHEIRNPLGSIRLYASVLREDLADRPEQQDTARKIAGAVSGLDAVVNDVLVFSKHIAPRRSPVEAEALLAQAVGSCADVIERTGVKLVSRVPDGLCVECDACLINQALVNVVRNACEAMEAEGVESPELRIDVTRKRALDAEGVRREMSSIAVIDCGPGVSPDVLARAFNPFFTTRHTGTGLGLAIVHRIVDAHLGRVIMKNNESPERGLTVEFLIPTGVRTEPDAEEAPR
ncbi:MAG: histidine kinase dimerization/phospho-acceptor domain-containing protein [Phycisphaerales bacterium]